VGRESGPYGGQERRIQVFWWGNLRERGHLDDPVIDGRIILRWIFRNRDLDWIKLAHVRERWRALLNALMNLRVS
jgi:hypothetical protein